MLKYVVFMLQCVLVTVVLCEKNYNGGYTRIKRGKYNSNPSPRIYSRPPPGMPSQGWFSLTPPPNYETDDSPSYPGSYGPLSFPGPPSYPGSLGPSSYPGSRPSYPGNSRPPKVSKPQSDGLGDEDISNLIKHLSKADLDKIIQFSGRDKDIVKYEKHPFEKYSDYNSNKNEINVYSPGDKIKSITDTDIDYFKKLVEEMEAENKLKEIETVKQISYVTLPTPDSIYPSQNEYGSLDTEESMQRQQYINIGNVNTNSEVEENMPRPLNLRDNEDFEISFTKKVPNVIKAENFYELKNFGELPVMNYDSKLDTLSSYHVPHYTVTSQASHQSALSSYSSPHSYGSKIPPLEPAPPPSAAKSQSDAHLKAVKIWSHRSTGKAYTLHDDGTLSVEKPLRPSGRYGYP